MAMNRLALGLGLLASAVMVSGCDRTLDDYRREKVDQEIAKYQAVSGVYQGSLISNRSGGELGFATLELEADRVVGESNDRLSTEQRAVLRGKLTFSGNGNSVLTFRNGYYDPSTGLFRASIPVSRRGGKEVEINLAGKLTDSRLSGYVEAFGYREDGANFELLKSVSGAAAPISHGRLTPSPAPILRQFTGTAKYKDGSTQQAKLGVLTQELSTEEEFLYTLLPVRTVDATLEFGNNVTLLFKESQWDLRAGTLRGRVDGVRGADRYQLDLDCNRIALDGGRQGWKCRYVSSIRGYLFDADFEPSDEDYKGK